VFVRRRVEKSGEGEEGAKTLLGRTMSERKPQTKKKNTMKNCEKKE